MVIGSAAELRSRQSKSPGWPLGARVPTVRPVHTLAPSLAGAWSTTQSIPAVVPVCTVVHGPAGVMLGPALAPRASARLGTVSSGTVWSTGGTTTCTGLPKSENSIDEVRIVWSPAALGSTGAKAAPVTVIS